MWLFLRRSLKCKEGQEHLSEAKQFGQNRGWDRRKGHTWVTNLFYGKRIACLTFLLGITLK